METSKSNKRSGARDHVELVCSVAELGSLFAGTRSLDDFLRKVVHTVAEHMHVPVCSVYLYNEERQELVLRATKGLKPRSSGAVRLRLGEGITGAAVRELRPIRATRASTDPRFKLFPEIEEEQYEAFLVVPILRGLNRIGALVVQHRQPGYFKESDTAALRAISSQLAGAIENTKLFLEQTADAREELIAAAPGEHEVGGRLFIRGTPGSHGFAQGKAILYGILSRRELLLAAAENGDCTLSLSDFERALEQTEQDLEALQRSLESQALDLQASLIFNAHLLMLKDPAFADKIRASIKSGQSPCAAVLDTVQEYATAFGQSPNPRLREKVQDVNDLGHRLLCHLMPNELAEGDCRDRIVIAGETLPSDMLKIAAQKAAGMIIAKGACTAHVSILARSLGIPMVIADDPRLLQLSEHEELLVDGAQGTVYVNPEQTVIEQYQKLGRARQRAAAETARPDAPLQTSDRQRIRVFANINLISEIELAKQLGAEGIGLYRSEFPFLIRNDFPSEEEQYRIYRKIVEEMAGREVTFRTLDVGGDKMLSYFPAVSEANPFLGLRAIRFSLQYQTIFQQQLRALLRAGAGLAKKMRIMFPLISSLDDFLQAKEVVEECRLQLTREKVDFNPEPRLGVMIELPSAVELARELAREADFLCLGTNDLIQYMLAADRTNPEVASYYQPRHPAVLRALHRVAKAARLEKRTLSLCGEMVNDSGLMPFLMGIGIRDFSLDPHGIADFRRAVRQIHVGQAEKQAREILAMPTTREVEKLSRPQSASGN